MLDRRSFLVRERVAFMRLSDTYDILDAQTGETLGVAEERISEAVKWLRLLLGKRLLPSHVVLAAHPGGVPLLHIRRGPAFLRAHVEVLDATGRMLGTLRSKLISLSGGFIVLDASGREAGMVNGDLIGWNFAFMTGGRRVGTVTKKWAGLAKEYFTNADNYVIAVDDPDASPVLVSLVLASGIAIDTVFKERKK